MSTAYMVPCVTHRILAFKSLLQRGYTIKATVRDPDDPKKTQHLRALEGAKGRLHLSKADLQEEVSFDSAINGCEAVFHTATPVLFLASDPQAEIVDLAVRVTLNVLRSCAKFPSVKRVVMTSSTAAVEFTGRPLTSGAVLDETRFSNPAIICEELKVCK